MAAVRDLKRTAVDVVVPFAGAAAQLERLVARLGDVQLRADDSLTIVDNRRGAPAAAGANLLAAPERQSSYYARNRGAAVGRAPWILFLDADVVAPPDIVDRYLATPVDARTAVLAGAIRDIEPEGGSAVARRYARFSQPLNDETAWQPGFAYAQTASAAVRRRAFEEVGGFAEVVSGGDADLCFRLVKAGWAIERRPEAVVEHFSRASIRGLMRQNARYGAGTQWLERRHPGFAPPRQRLRAVKAALLGGVQGAVAFARGDRDAAVRKAIDPLCLVAFEAGRHRTNELDGSSAVRRPPYAAE